MEKLITPVTVKFSPEGAAELSLLAQADGMEVSEFVRHLVELKKLAERERWKVMSQVFGNEEPNSTFTRDNKVGREP
ncbi:MAG: hypothetical protein LAD29_10570 [Rhodoferax sp.]|nr:hypothetical protein [Rhodoferax sp.]